MVINKKVSKVYKFAEVIFVGEVFVGTVFVETGFFSMTSDHATSILLSQVITKSSIILLHIRHFHLEFFIRM